MTTYTTQPLPEAIAEALDALHAITTDDVDVEVLVRVELASARLVDCVPPYPPRAQPAPTLAADDAIATARAALGRAAATAGTAEEAVRVGWAARALAEDGRP